MDPITMEALQLFAKEDHPSLLSKGSAKEGLSLYQLLNRCKTPGGKNLLRLWLLRPPIDLGIINERLDAVSFFSSKNDIMRTEMVFQLADCLKHVKDLPKIAQRIRTVRSTIPDWKHLHQSLLSIGKMYQLLNEDDFVDSNYSSDPTSSGQSSRERGLSSPRIELLEHRIPILEKARVAFGDGELMMIADFIENVIDFEESTKESRLVVKPGVSADLDELKRIFEGLGDFLTEVAREEIPLLPSPLASELHVVYFPQLGFLIALPLVQSLIQSPNQLLQFGLRFQFRTEANSYYKNQRTDELDEFIGDIHGKIVDMEDFLTRQIEVKILDKSEAYKEVHSCASELDILLSFADVALEKNWTRPQLTHENVIHIQNGIHPLQAQCLDRFIPNDTSMCIGEGIVQIITGPNESGKSVYLKQVGLLSYLSHLGSFVPAERCVIGTMDRIFSRIRSHESVSVTQSSFLIDCNQVNLMLRHSTERSLLLIDEFGKGTAPSDGIALLVACIKSLLSRPIGCPKVVATTHFSEIFEYRLLQVEDAQRGNIALLTPDYVIQEGSPNIVFVYKMKEGVSNESHGLHCAKAAGVSDEVIERAKYIGTRLKNSLPITRFVDGYQAKAVENKKRNLHLIKALGALDCEKGDVQGFLRDYILNKEE